jgi:hypothetical protein
MGNRNDALSPRMGSTDIGRHLGVGVGERQLGAEPFSSPGFHGFGDASEFVGRGHPDADAAMALRNLVEALP